MQYDFRSLMTTGRMSKCIGVDRRTLISWAEKGIIPVFVNPANSYRYFNKIDVINALGFKKNTIGAVDVTDHNE